MGECAPSTKERNLKKKVGNFFRSLNSVKVNRDRGSPSVGGGVPAKTIGLVLAVAIILPLLGGTPQVGAVSLSNR